MNNRIQLGHVSRFWDDSFKTLSYIKQPVTDEEIHEWEKMGYYEDNVKSFTGSMYDNRNVMPEWVNLLENVLGMYNQTYTIYRMDTCEIMPSHSDHFRTYCRLNNCQPDQVNRAILMLEDWKPGHYFELDGVGYVNWKAGDWFKWQGDVPHAASNIGPESRYTLQITGLSVLSGQLNKLFCFNIPGILDAPDHPFVTNDIRPKISENRAMVYMNNSSILELNDISHDKDAQDVLNEDGLHIYLYEPLCSFDIEDPGHNRGFYSEFTNIRPEQLRADELESIYGYAMRNNLTNITVHTCDYNVDKWYPCYSDRLKLVCDDLFLKTQKKIINLNEKFKVQFNKKFICLNWRFTKHRQLISTFIAGDDVYLSWHHKASFDSLSKNSFFDIDTWEEKYIEFYCRLKNNCDLVMKHAPYVIDINPVDAIKIENPHNIDIWPNVEKYSPGETPALHNRVSNVLADFYTNSFVDVINETRFAQPTGNFSEKVFQAIQYQKPFILVAPPKTLEYIRSLGFKTFNDFWDESYDDECDHGERLAKIFTLIQQIIDMPMEDAHEMYTNMHSIVDHNLTVYKEFIK